MKNLVIFDLDGTLLYTLKDLQIAVNAALMKYGYREKTLEEIRSFVGNGISKLIERVLPAGMENLDYDNVLKEFILQYAKNEDANTCPYEGVLEVLDSLVQSGYELAINSNKHNDAVQVLAKRFFPQVRIALGAREGVNVKPNPQGVFDILNFFKEDFEKVFFVGDSDVDVMTAKNAKITSVGVTWGYRSKQSLVEAGADYVIDKPIELLEILGN